jgi:CBS domain-containing protein
MSVVWLTASPQDSVTHVMREMTEKRARHVPVLSEGDLVGVISIDDVLKLRLVEESQEAEVQG